MVRTKHLFITGVLLAGTIAVSIFGVLFVQTPTISVATMPAAVILGTPAEEYPVVVDTYDENTREAFIEQVRNGYVPPPPNPAPEPEPVVYTPAPAPVAASLPIAIVEEPITTGTTTASTTPSSTLEISSTSTTATGEVSSSTENHTI